MPDLLDQGALPKGVAIRSGITIKEKPGVAISFEIGHPAGPVHLVMRRREALALGLQLSQAAHRLSRDEDRG